MPLLNHSKNEEKEIKDMINKNIATSMKTQPSFIKLLKLNGCPTIKVGSMGNKIRKQLLKEAKNGDLTVDTVMPRAYYLIGEFLGIDDVKRVNDLRNINFYVIRENGFNVTLPYTTSGVRMGQAGGNAFGGATYLSTSLGEGKTNWKNSKVFFVENGLRIVETGQFIHYKQIDYIDYSENSDKKALIDLKRNTITFIMKNGEQIIMRVLAEDLNAIRHWIDIDMENIEKTKVDNNNDDILIKYFDMFEKGLITREEFDKKKEQLLLNNAPENDDVEPQPPLKNKPLFCSNCGARLELDSNFCSACGSQIK